MIYRKIFEFASSAHLFFAEKKPQYQNHWYNIKLKTSGFSSDKFWTLPNCPCFSWDEPSNFLNFSPFRGLIISHKFSNFGNFRVLFEDTFKISVSYIKSFLDFGKDEMLYDRFYNNIADVYIYASFTPTVFAYKFLIPMCRFYANTCSRTRGI